jgi:hypothetical protein
VSSAQSAVEFFIPLFQLSPEGEKIQESRRFTGDHSLGRISVGVGEQDDGYTNQIVTTVISGRQLKRKGMR